MRATCVLRCVTFPLSVTLSASSCAGTMARPAPLGGATAPLKTVVSLEGRITTEPATSIILPVPDTTYALRSTDAARGPTRIVSAAEADYSQVSALLRDEAGYQRVIHLRVSRHVGGCPDPQAMNVASNCVGSSTLSFHVDVYPDDNPDLPVGDYAGRLSLVAEKLAGSGRLPVEINIHLSQFGSVFPMAEHWQF